MGLSEREYARKVTRNVPITNRTIKFIKETFKLFSASLFVAAIGTYATIPYVDMISKYYIGFIIVEFLMLFGLILTKNKLQLNIIMLFLFTFFTGVTTVPLLDNILSMTNGFLIIGNAFFMTSLTMAVMSYYAIKTKKDLTNYSKALMISLFVIIIMSLLNMVLFHIPILSLFISAIITVIFSFLVVIDIQNIIQNKTPTPVEGAIKLYLDFFNIFVSFLQIIGILNTKE